MDNQTSSAVTTPTQEGQAPKTRGMIPSLWDVFEDQFALRSLISEYMIPIEANTIWYTLGGVLAISLGFETLTGILLALRYQPDAGVAYSITQQLIQSPLVGSQRLLYSMDYDFDKALCAVGRLMQNQGWAWRIKFTASSK